MPRIAQNIENQIKKAKETKNASELDLALRAQYHFAHNGQAVDTTEMQFPEVKQVDPTFYEHFGYKRAY